MKHIKSIVSLLLALTLALSLTACGSQANTEPEQPDDTPTAAEVNLCAVRPHRHRCHEPVGRR